MRITNTNLLLAPFLITAVISELVSQDIFTHSSESYLIFEGRLTKADDSLYVNADEVALTNNTIMHLFS